MAELTIAIGFGPTSPPSRSRRWGHRPIAVRGYPGGCEKVNQQLVDAPSLVMMGPVRGVGQRSTRSRLGTSS